MKSHENLSNHAISCFKSACDFHEESGIEVSKYTSQLQTTLDELAKAVKSLEAISFIPKAYTKAKAEYIKIMNTEVNNTSMSNVELQECHDNTLNYVLILFKLDVRGLTDNWEDYVKSLRETLTGSCFADFQNPNDKLKRREL